jgi:Virulence factor
MAATLTVIWWRDIPAQVLARGRAGTEKVVLPQRFQLAIDRAADVAGRTGSDAYLAEWRRVTRPCGDDLAAEAGAEAQALEARYPRGELQRLADAGGVDRPPAAAGEREGGADSATGRGDVARTGGSER